MLAADSFKNKPSVQPAESREDQARPATSSKSVQAPLPEVELVARFCAGDHAAFTELFEQQKRKIWCYIERMISDNHMIEEAFQLTWLNVWNYRNKLRQPKAFVKWLYSIARNSAFTILRRHNNDMRIKIVDFEEGDFDPMDNVPDNDPGPQRKAELKELERMLETELSSMDPITQEIMAFRFNAGLKLREIADVMDLPVGTVGTRLRRGLAQLREQMEKYDLKGW